jgi:superfamily I DNA and/or RNA helicase
VGLQCGPANHVSECTLRNHFLFYPIGLLRSEFFKRLDHNTNVIFYQEDESLSKSNRHEATFVAKLASYLMLQGYEASQITVLTAYSGQVKLLRNEFRVLGINSIYITSVDNFQVSLALL